MGSPRSITFDSHKENCKSKNDGDLFSCDINTHHGDIYITLEDTQFLSKHFFKENNNIKGPRVTITGRINKYRLCSFCKKRLKN